MVIPFLDWAEASRICSFRELDVRAMRAYRLDMAARVGRHGRRLRPHTVLHSNGALRTIMGWADAEGDDVDVRILDLPRPKVPELEPDVFHMEQLRVTLGACNPGAPQEALAVRILVGSGLRASELCGLALTPPDGQSDVVMDCLPGEGAELRVRWDASAEGRKSRQVPVVPALVTAIRRYRDRDRPAVAQRRAADQRPRGAVPALRGGRGDGRLQRRVGFRGRRS
jgi:integrase